MKHLCAAQADKHSLVDTLGIPYRDLRILDPMVRQDPSATRAYQPHVHNIMHDLVLKV